MLQLRHLAWELLLLLLPSNGAEARLTRSGMTPLGVDEAAEGVRLSNLPRTEKERQSQIKQGYPYQIKNNLS